MSFSHEGLVLVSVPVKVLDDHGLKATSCTVPNSSWDRNSESFSNAGLNISSSFMIAKQ